MRDDGQLPLWCPTPPSYDDAVAASRPVFDRPELRYRRTAALARGTRHPWWTVRTLAGLRDVRAVASLLLWQETALWCGYGTGDVVGHGPVAMPTARDLRRLTELPTTSRDITGLVIAQDEARLIARVLRSLAPFVAQTVVVDGGSTDGTVDIARSEGAHVVERRFDADFAAQRNAGVAQVRTPWVLMLDCDEQLPPDLGQVLLRAAAVDVDAVYIPLLNLVGEDPTPTLFPDVQPRMFRSHLRYSGHVHERLHPRTGLNLPVSGPFIHHHKSPLRHYSNSLRYSEIDPAQSTPELVAWMQQEVDRLRRAGPGDGDLPRTAE
jgi:hypothetical protein